MATKRESKSTAVHIVAQIFPLEQAVETRRYGSLIDINPSGKNQVEKTAQGEVT